MQEIIFATTFYLMQLLYKNKEKIMKKHTKFILNTILSTSLIGSTIGLSLALSLCSKEIPKIL